MVCTVKAIALLFVWELDPLLSHNLNVGLRMARHTDPAVVKAELQNLLQGVAKHFLERVYGPDGMPWGTKFSELEELAVVLGQAVSQNMIDQALARQAQAVPPEAETCSGCEGPVTSTSVTEPRAVTTQVGTAQWNEPKRFCPTCRVAFFPSVPQSGD
jgi:hypothetical protein